jgi:hypothetical protein
MRRFFRNAEEPGIPHSFPPLDCFAFSIMESITDLDINLPWVVPVEATEGLAVIEVDSAVGHVQGIQRRGESLAEVLTDRKIKGGVLRQVVPWIWVPRKSIAEARAVVEVGGGKRTPRKSDVATKIESISLIVVKREEVARRRKIRQAPRDGQFAFRYLIGVRKVDSMLGYCGVKSFPGIDPFSRSLGNGSYGI